jgi:uncharacterized protein YeaO (DUF488 family)
VSARIRLKRVQDPPEPTDGFRVLVDRLWPRGVRKSELAHDLWLKEIAPSSDLRRWFGHEPARWQEFRERYRRELARAQQPLSVLLEACEQGPVTLLFAARDREHNQAVVLREVLLEELTALAQEREYASPVCYAHQFPDDNGSS